MDDTNRGDDIGSMRYTASGQRLHERVSYSCAAAIVISDITLMENDVHYTNRRWLAPYTPQYAKSGGQKLLPGVRSHVTLTNAEFGYGLFEVEFILRSNSYNGFEPPFAVASISTKAASFPTIHRLEPRDYEAFSRKSSLHVDGEDPYNAVYKLSLRVNKADIRYTERRGILLRLERDRVLGWDHALQYTKKNCTDFASEEILIDVFLPGHNKEPERLAGSLSRTITVARNEPYEFLFQKVPRARVFVSPDDMPDTQECGFVVPDAPIDVFDSVMEQTARLGIALRDEFQLTDALMALAEKRPSLTVAFELPGHKVKGVVAGFLFLWQQPDMELIPEEGEHFAIRIDGVAFDQPPSPEVHLTTEEKCKRITGRIVENCSIARDTARKDEKLYQGYVYEALDGVVKAGNSRAEWIALHAKDLMPYKRVPATDTSAEKPAELASAHHTRIADWVKKMFDLGYLKMPVQVVDHCPDLMAVRIPVPIWMHGIGVVGAYVRAPAVPGWPKNVYPVPRIDIKIPRLSLFADPRETVRRVNDSKKKLTFVSRFIRTAHEGQLNAGLHALSESGADTRETNKDNFSSYMRYLAKAGGDTITYDLTTALPFLQEFLEHVEGNSWKDVDQGSPMGAAIARFRGLDEDQKDLFPMTKNLPFGTCVVSGGPGSGKTHVMGLLLAVMQHSPMRADVIAHWNGSSTHKPRPEEPDQWSKDAPPAEEPEEETFLQFKQPADYRHPLQAARDAHAQRMKRFGLGDETSKSEEVNTKQRMVDTTVGTAEDPDAGWTGGNTWNSGDNSSSQPNQFTGNEDAAPTDTSKTPQDEGSIDFADAPRPEEPCPTANDAMIRGQLLIVAPANDMLDKIARDMASLYEFLGLSKTVVRVQMPNTAARDTAHRLNPELGTSLYDEEEETGEDAFETELYLRKLSKDRLKKYRITTPSGGAFSVAAHVAARMQYPSPKDVTAAKLAGLEKQKQHDPDTFYATSHKEYLRLLKEARDEIYRDADVLLSTPEAYYKLAVRDIGLNIMLVWQDEAFRMTEPEALIAITHTKSAIARYFTGDDSQCEPIVKSADAHKSDDVDKAFCAQFGHQLRRSLPRRLVRAGAPVHYLNCNHRATGGVSHFPSMQYYAGNLYEDPHAEVPPEQKRVMKFFKALAGKECGTALVVDLPGGQESQIGTSWVNTDSIKVIIALLKLVYGDNMLCDKLPAEDLNGELISVMVTFYYKQQLMRFREELAKIPPSELPMHKIRSGVVQTIQGMEAGLVICDGTRDVAPGFTGQAQLHNTAITRAKYGYIVIHCSKIWKKGKKGIHARDRRVRNMAALHKYAETRGAVVQLNKGFFKDRAKSAYRKECTVCPPGQNRHFAADCPTAWLTSRSSALPRNTVLTDELIGFDGRHLYDTTKVRTQTRYTPRELVGLEDKEVKTNLSQSDKPALLNKAVAARGIVQQQADIERQRKHDWRTANIATGLKATDWPDFQEREAPNEFKVTEQEPVRDTTAESDITKATTESKTAEAVADSESTGEPDSQNNQRTGTIFNSEGDAVVKCVKNLVKNLPEAETPQEFGDGFYYVVEGNEWVVYRTVDGSTDRLHLDPQTGEVIKVEGQVSDEVLSVLRVAVDHREGKVEYFPQIIARFREYLDATNLVVNQTAPEPAMATEDNSDDCGVESEEDNQLEDRIW